MAPSAENNDVGNKECDNLILLAFSSGAGKVLGFIGVVILSNVAHHLLKPLAQPQITSDIVIGLVFGNISLIRKGFQGPSLATLDNIVEFGMICHMFVLGLEMDPYVIIKPPTRDAMVAYAGMLSTFILACSITPLLQYSTNKSLQFTLALSIMIAGNGSPVLTRLITNLKIGKSDIGRLGTAAGVHSDMIATLFYCIGYIVFPTEKKLATHERVKNAIKMSSALVVQIVFTAKVSPVLLNWVNNENPEGKPLKGSHLVMSLAFMVLICSWTSWYDYNPILSAFVAGLFLPNEGRISKWLINKINYLLRTLFYPIFFFWVGLLANLQNFDLQWMTLARFFCLVMIATVGKVVGTVICGLMLGFHWPETVALGLLLTAKGHFHIFLATLANREGTISSTTGALMIFVVFLSVVHTPFVVRNIIKRARKRVPTHRMSLQWFDPSDELRILLGIHGPNNVASTINFMEISRGEVGPGIVFYATDIVELTDEIAATLEHGEGAEGMTVTDESVTDMREQISAAVQSYVDDNSEGITIKRMLILSTFSNMAQDICALAEDLMVSLIILPFHKRQITDGTLDTGHPGFRYVNRKVLRGAPCSVGILVDRSFGTIEKISKSRVCTEVAVIFIGGKDDREALAFAGQVSRHPGVKLTVIRFLVDKNLETAQKRAANSRVSVAEQDEEMKLDDESFADFYERHVAAGHVAYMEKHLVNSSETFTTLRSLEGHYSLIIVGRGGRVNTVLTIGLNDWQQCPELGPIGDVLSGSDFSVRTSVLIIQQQHTRGQLEGLDDDFSIM